MGDGAPEGVAGAAAGGPLIGVLAAAECVLGVGGEGFGGAGVGFLGLLSGRGVRGQRRGAGDGQ